MIVNSAEILVKISPIESFGTKRYAGKVPIAVSHN